MRRWNQTTIVWHMWDYWVDKGNEIFTNIPVSSPQNPSQPFYKCSLIKAISHADASMRFSLTFRHDDFPPCVEDGEKIERIIRELSGRNGIVMLDTPSGGLVDTFTLCLPLNNGESFCEQAIEMMAEIFKLLGIEDLEGKLRGNFDITQTTYVWKNGDWRPFKDWLREKYGFQEPYVYHYSN